MAVSVTNKETAARKEPSFPPLTPPPRVLATRIHQALQQLSQTGRAKIWKSLSSWLHRTIINESTTRVTRNHIIRGMRRCEVQPYDWRRNESQQPIEDEWPHKTRETPTPRPQRVQENLQTRKAVRQEEKKRVRKLQCCHNTGRSTYRQSVLVAFFP